MVHLVCSWCNLVLLVLIVGCGPKEAPTFPVSGTVTLDDEPLADGELYFRSPGLTPAIFAVKDGKFEGQARAGTHRVEICAYRPRAKEPVLPGGEPMEAPPENYIPAEFNAQSTMTAEVEAGGPNQFTFAAKLK